MGKRAVLKTFELGQEGEPLFGHAPVCSVTAVQQDTDFKAGLPSDAVRRCVVAAGWPTP
jgi:hypothetical protein